MTKNAFRQPKQEKYTVNVGKKEKMDTRPVCTITMEHFENALREFTPSMPERERIRYEMMYVATLLHSHFSDLRISSRLEGETSQTPQALRNKP
jgi:hypothetical protein